MVAQQVIEEDEDDGRHRGQAVGLGAPHEDEVGQAHLRQREAELGRGRRLLAARPSHCHRPANSGRQQDDVDRVDRLEDRRRNAGAIDEAVGEQVHRSARLLEQAPEQRIERDQEQDREHPLARLLLQLEALVEHVAEQRDAGDDQQALDDVLILDQRPDHRDRGDADRRKASTPSTSRAACGASPAPRSALLPSTKTTRPASMPMPARPKP